MASGDPQHFTAEVPAFRDGGLVERDGLALLHKDELVIPAEEARAQITPVELAAGDRVHLDFGVEVVVVGGIPEAEKVALEERLWSAFDAAIG
jgi:hypothetical protein